jgi:hypothetical protein
MMVQNILVQVEDMETKKGSCMNSVLDFAHLDTIVRKGQTNPYHVLMIHMPLLVGINVSSANQKRSIQDANIIVVVVMN